MVALDLGFEVVFVLFVLGTESDGLIDLLLSKTLREECGAILLLSLLVHVVGKLLQTARLVVLVLDLATKHVDLTLQVLVD